MNESMVEKARQAVVEAMLTWPGGADAVSFQNGLLFVSGDAHFDPAAIARAVMEAMREPTQEQVDATGGDLLNQPGDGVGPLRCDGAEWRGSCVVAENTRAVHNAGDGVRTTTTPTYPNYRGDYLPSEDGGKTFIGSPPAALKEGE